MNPLLSTNPELSEVAYVRPLKKCMSVKIFKPQCIKLKHWKLEKAKLFDPLQSLQLLNLIFLQSWKQTIGEHIFAFL